jgi:hypothetical protein
MWSKPTSGRRLGDAAAVVVDPPVIWVSLVLRSTVATRTVRLLECRAYGGVLLSTSPAGCHCRR